MNGLGKVSRELRREVVKIGRKIIDDPVVKDAQDNYRKEAVGGFKGHAERAVRPMSGSTGMGVRLKSGDQRFREAASLEFGALVHFVPAGRTGRSVPVAQEDMSRRLAPRWVGNKSLGTDFGSLPGHVVMKAMKENRRETFDRWSKETLAFIDETVKRG
jgi:hypothetical protein